MTRSRARAVSRLPPLVPLILAVAVCAYTILQTCVTPITPLLARRFDTTLDTSTWVYTAGLLSAAVCVPVLGRVGDALGKKKVIVACALSAACGCAISALAPTIEVMIAGRAVQGLGVGLIPLAFAIVRDVLPHERVSGTIGGLAASLGVGSALGFVIAGPVVDHFGYAGVFWIPGFVLATVALASLLFLPISPVVSSERISWSTAIVFSLALLALLLGITEGPHEGWRSQTVGGYFAAAALLALLWVQLERRSISPLLELRMMRDTSVWICNLVALLVGVGYYSILVLLPQFLQAPATLGYGFASSISQAGLTLLPLSVVFLVASGGSGLLNRRFGAKPVLAGGCATSGGGMLLLTLAHSTPWHVLVVTLLLGSGFGITVASMAAIVVRSVPVAQTGVASGLNTNVRMIGGALGTAATGSILATQPGPGGFPTEGGYVAAFGLLSLALIASSAVALLLPEAPRVQSRRGRTFLDRSQ